MALTWQGPTTLSCAKHKILLSCNMYVVDCSICHGRIGNPIKSLYFVILIINNPEIVSVVNYNFMFSMAIGLSSRFPYIGLLTFNTLRISLELWHCLVFNFLQLYCHIVKDMLVYSVIKYVLGQLNKTMRCLKVTHFIMISTAFPFASE